MISHGFVRQSKRALTRKVDIEVLEKEIWGMYRYVTNGDSVLDFFYQYGNFLVSLTKDFYIKTLNALLY